MVNLRVRPTSQIVIKSMEKKAVFWMSVLNAVISQILSCNYLDPLSLTGEQEDGEDLSGVLIEYFKMISKVKRVADCFTCLGAPGSCIFCKDLGQSSRFNSEAGKPQSDLRPYCLPLYKVCVFGTHAAWHSHIQNDQCGVPCLPRSFP